MKYHYLKSEIIIFLIVLIFLVLPPCFVLNNPSYTDSPLSYFNFTWIFSIFGYIYYRDRSSKNNKSDLNEGLSETDIIKTNENPAFKTRIKTFFFKFIIPVLFCLAALFSLLFMMNAIASLIDYKQNIYSIQKSDENYIWLYKSLSYLLIASFSEEFIYRYYFPDMLHHIINHKYDNKTVTFVCEFLTCILFAFGHLYAGFLSVIFAGLSHLIFRSVYKQTGNIFVTFVSHFIYNTIVLILL